jgi:hypothetical protein
VFWIDTGATGKQRTDLPLYVRTGANSAWALGRVRQLPRPARVQRPGRPVGHGQVAGETFLRISNAESAVCTACHVK